MILASSTLASLSSIAKYLALTAGLSYLASLGLAMIVFVHVAGQGGLIFVLPLLDVRQIVRRSAHPHDSGSPARPTPRRIILAGTLAVLGIAGGSSEAQQIGYTIAFAVLLDTLFVRRLLIPSIAMLLGPVDRWPSTAVPAREAPATSRQPAVR